MKGINWMELNNATMCEAVQHWLNSKFVGVVPAVVNVLRETDGTFRIVLKEPTAPDGEG